MENENRLCWICLSHDSYSAFHKETTFQSGLNKLAFCFYTGRNKNNHHAKDISSNIEGEWISPCKCKGGSKWVHQSCLLEWIKIQSKNINTLVTSNVSLPLSNHHEEEVTNSSSLFNIVFQSDSTRSTRSPNFTLRNVSDGSVFTLTSSGASRYLVFSNEKICCPQCRYPYRLSQLTSSLYYGTLEKLILGGRKLMMYMLMGGVVFLGYTVLWTTGFVTLSVLFGHEEFRRLCFPLANTTTFQDVTEMISLRNLYFLYVGIPFFPLSMIFSLSSDRSGFSHISWSHIFLYYSAYLYVPNAASSILFWAVPLSWILYSKLREKVARLLGIPMKQFEMAVDIDSSDDEDDESFHINFNSTRHTASATTDDDGESDRGSISDSESSAPMNTSESETIMVSEEENSITDGSHVAQSETDDRHSESSSIWPSSGHGSEENFRPQTAPSPPVALAAEPHQHHVLGTFTLGSITGVLSLPFFSAFVSSFLKRLFNPAYIVGSTKTPLLIYLLSDIGKYLPSVVRNIFVKGYWRFGTFLHGLSTLHRNLLVGALLVFLKDIVVFSLAIEKERIVNSRKVLNYKE